MKCGMDDILQPSNIVLEFWRSLWPIALRQSMISSQGRTPRKIVAVPRTILCCQNFQRAWIMLRSMYGLDLATQSSWICLEAKCEGSFQASGTVLRLTKVSENDFWKRLIESLLLHLRLVECTTQDSHARYMFERSWMHFSSKILDGRPKMLRHSQ